MSEVILVTGASRGIGAACARALANCGRTIAVNYISNSNAAASVVSDIEKAGGRAVSIQGDVGVENDIHAMFAKVDGLGQLVGLINNAGIVGPPERVDEMSTERIARIMNINVMGSILCAREAVRRMSTKLGGSGGVIVNVSSVAALLGSPKQYVDYAASKGAIDVFTKGLALEVADEGVRVVAVRPGVIDTDIHASGGQPDRAIQLRSVIPMKREGTAQEVAEAIVWLMSDKASYVTGGILDVSGGR